MPVAVPLVPLVALCVALFLFMVAKSWDASFGPMLERLAQFAETKRIAIRAAPDIHFSFLARWLRSVNATTRHLLGAAIAFTSAPLIIVLRYMANVLERPANELAGLAADTYHSLNSLRRYVVPAMIGAALGPLAATVAVLAPQVAGLLKRAPVHVVHELTKITTKATTTVINRAVAIPFPRIGRLERQAGAIAGRLGRIERDIKSAEKRLARIATRTAPAVAVGAVALALRRLGHGWLRCSRVRRVGKRVCGMDTSMLDDLLLGTLAIVGTVSLVETARDMQTLTEPIMDFTAALVREL